jgi:hypothetical protein
MKRVLRGVVVVIAVGVIGMGVWGGFLSYARNIDWIMDVTRFPQDSTAQVRGQFGDEYGALNALISALAFAALVAAVVLQTRELAAQRHELQTTIGLYERQMLNETERARTERTLHLYSDWNSERLLNARKILLEEKRRNAVFPLVGVSAYEEVGGPIGGSVLIVHGFFEEWATLAKYERIDRELMWALLGGSYEQWRRAVLSPCWAVEENEDVKRVRDLMESTIPPSRDDVRVSLEPS